MLGPCLLNTPPTLFRRDDAERMAAELNKADPEWSYLAVHSPHPNGRSTIAIHDETGQLIGHWSE